MGKQTKTLRSLLFVLKIWQIAALAFFSIAMLSGCSVTIQNKHLRFSPDGKFLTYVHCARGGCRSVIYDITKGTYKSLQDSEGRSLTSLSFSPSGKKMVAVAKVTDPDTGKDIQQLAVGSLEDGKFQVITQEAGIKITPTFWDEKTVIYWHGEPIRDSKRFRPSLRAVDLVDKKEWIVMSDRERFYQPSTPNPVGDGEHIIFSDYCYKEPDDYGPRQSPCADKILRVSLNQKTKTLLDTGFVNSTKPVMAQSIGKLYFASRLEQKEGQHGFAYEVYAQDEKTVQRITYLRTYMSSFAVTQDGKRLAMVVREPAKSHTGRVLLLNPETGEEKILVPKDSEIVTIKWVAAV